jgi:hypothetical protein
MSTKPIKFYQSDITPIVIEPTLQRAIKTALGENLEVDQLITLDGITSTVLQLARAGAIRLISAPLKELIWMTQ